MLLFHLSHTDLDGYGCQLLTKEFFVKGFFYNANYGLEVKLNLNKILDKIKENIEEEILFIISDLNLTPNEAKDLDKQISLLNGEGAKIKLQLLDHHITGEKSAAKYDWYYLDITRCATKIVYDYLYEEYEGFSEQDNSWIKPMVDAINAVDIWLEHETKNFEFGKVLMRLVTQAGEINNILFSAENRNYRMWLLKKASQYINEPDGNIILDDNIHFLKKEYLTLDNKNNTIDNLSARYLVQTLENKKEQLTIFYKEHKGLLTFTLGSISISANAFLKANPEYDFFIDVSRRGGISLRADGQLDVSAMAQKLANGGGHPNAAGAKFDDFPETVIYEDVKKFIEEKLKRIK